MNHHPIPVAVALYITKHCEPKTSYCEHMQVTEYGAQVKACLSCRAKTREIFPDRVNVQRRNMVRRPKCCQSICSAYTSCFTSIYTYQIVQDVLGMSFSSPVRRRLC